MKGTTSILTVKAPNNPCKAYSLPGKENWLIDYKEEEEVPLALKSRYWFRIIEAL